MNGLGGKLHRHQKGVVQRHNDCPFDVVFRHDLPIAMYVGVPPHILRIGVGAVHRVRHDVDMGIDLFKRLPFGRVDIFSHFSLCPCK